MVHTGNSNPGGDLLPSFFSPTIFIAVLLRLMDFSDIAILRGRPNSCCQQNFKYFDMPYYP